MVTRLSLLALACALGACTPSYNNTCAAGYVFDASGRCVVADGGAMGDAGQDAGASDAYVACGGRCTGTTPHCLLPGETCVACTGDGDCSGATPHCEPTGHTCVACVGDGDCSGGTPRCEPSAHVCAQCLGASDCTSATASHCDTTSHLCGACTTNADCAHLTGTTVCDAGTCRACTVTDETACGANSCDPATHACTATPRGSVATCRACAADSECASAMDRCVPMQFMGSAHGSYCLRQGAVGCMRPYTVPTPSRASASGAAAAAYCGVDETVTTCEAVQALIADVACTTATDCGATGLADGLCQTVNLVANHCTYTCGLSSQCPSGANCGGAGYCGSP